MGSVRHWIAAAVCLSNISSPLAFARGSMQATQLAIIPLDPEIRCNRTFFKGTEQYKGTAFFMPRMVQSPYGDIFYDVERTTSGRYALTVRFFFPTSDYDVASKNATDSRADSDGCNMDSVKLALNRSLPEGEKILKTAPAPLSSVEIKIRGIRDIGHLERTESDKTEQPATTVSVTEPPEVDVLEYYGKVRSAQFIVSEEELAYFRSAVRNNDGISAQVKFGFKARAMDGGMSANLNITELKKKLEAAANGSAYMVTADIKAALSSNLDERSVSITNEAGSEEANKIIQDLIKQATEQFSLAVDKAVEEAALKGDTEAQEGKIKVQVAIQLLSTVVKRSLSYTGFSSPERAIVDTEIRLKTSVLSNYNVVPIRVAADYLDPNVGIDLQEGDKFAIAANSWILDNIKQVPKRTYMTTSMIRYHQIGPLIPKLADTTMTLEDKTVNGIDIAVGTEKSWFGMINGGNFSEYRFILLTNEPVRIPENSDQITDFAGTINKIPVGVSFTGLNERKIFLLSDLLKPNEDWDAKFDRHDRLVITAKTYLGDVIFRDRIREGNGVVTGPPVAVYQAYMETVGPLGGLGKVSNLVTLKTDYKPIVQQMTYKFSVTLPQAFKKANVNSAPGQGDLKQPEDKAKTSPVLPSAPLPDPELPEQP